MSGASAAEETIEHSAETPVSADALLALRDEVVQTEKVATKAGLLDTSQELTQIEQVLTSLADNRQPLNQAWVDAIKDHLHNAAWLADQVKDQNETLRRITSSLQTLRGPEILDPNRERRCLLVGTSKAQAHIYGRALEWLDIHFVSMSDGYKALGRLMRERFDFVLTSQNLDGVKGFALIGALRDSDGASRQAPAVIVTADESLLTRPVPPSTWAMLKDNHLPTRLNNLFGQLIDAERNGHVMLAMPAMLPPG